LNPLLESYLLGGLYCATDAHANPFKVTQAFARAAQSQNATLMTRTPVEGIDSDGGRVRAVVTSQGRIAADWVVNAAGPYANAIGAMVGVEHAVVPRRGQIVVLEASAGLPAIRVSGASQLLAKHAKAPGAEARTNVSLSYTRKALSGTVLLGSTNEFAGFDTRNTIDAVTGICACATRFMPRLGTLNVLRSWAGLRPYSASGPLLGRIGGPENYLVASGHGGDGMALSPISGRYLAELIAHHREPVTLDAFLRRCETEEASRALAS
jgi:sarcosine oxidase subunit beta